MPKIEIVFQNQGTPNAGQVVLSFNHLEIIRNIFGDGDLSKFLLYRANIQIETVSYELKVYATGSKTQPCLQFLDEQVIKFLNRNFSQKQKTEIRKFHSKFESQIESKYREPIHSDKKT